MNEYIYSESIYDFKVNGLNPQSLSKKEKFILEEAMKTQRGSRGIGLTPFFL